VTTEEKPTLRPSSTPSISNDSDHDESDGDEPVEDCRPIHQLIADLTSELSQVKNKRMCQYSAYDYLRLLSVLRFFEKTEKTSSDTRLHKEVALELAEIFWVHKSDSPHSPRNTLQHKANLIQQWAKEYRATGRLSEHVHGTHTKTESKLAEKEIARAARRVLANMKDPGPVKLKEILVSTIFPKFGIPGAKISENTCRDYMKRWGWHRGGYREWVVNNKRVLQVSDSETDEKAGGSDETDILETTRADPGNPPSVSSIQEWPRNLPSPTTAIRPASTVLPDMSANGGHVFEFQNPHSVTLTSPIFNNNATNPMEDRNAALFLPSNYDLNQTHNYSFPIHPAYMDPAQFHAQAQYVAQQQNRYTPKSLDGLVPDPPGMMGMRPAPHGAPVPTFAPHPSMLGAFTHDSSFPSQPTRRNTVNIPPNSEYNPLSHQHYMTDMNQ
jgi:hypothetical protein